MPHLLATALARRETLLSTATDVVRVIDGAGDGLPGVELEIWAGRWLLATRDREPPRDLTDELRATGQPAWHKRLDRQQKDVPHLLSGPALSDPFLVREHGVVFEASFRVGYSQGLFLDQRDNRRRVASRIRPGQTVLNTFAYTGAFSVVAALAGAETTTLDLAQPCLDWAKRNFTHNLLDPASHHFCKGDTFQWLRRFAKQGRRFDAIILDPPTFSRDDQGRVFRVESDYTELARLALACLSPDGWLLCSTNCRKLSAAAFERQLRAASHRPLHLTFFPMPADFPGEPYLKSCLVVPD